MSLHTHSTFSPSHSLSLSTGHGRFRGIGHVRRVLPDFSGVLGQRLSLRKNFRRKDNMTHTHTPYTHTHTHLHTPYTHTPYTSLNVHSYGFPTHAHKNKRFHIASLCLSLVDENRAQCSCPSVLTSRLPPEEHTPATTAASGRPSSLQRHLCGPLLSPAALRASAKTAPPPRRPAHVWR